MGGFSEGFALGDRVLSKALQRREDWREKPAREQAERDEAANKKRLGELRVMNEEMRYEAYRRESNRAMDDDNRQKTKMRLALQAAMVSGQMNGVDHNVMYDALPDIYMGIVNEQDQDLIDPEGDGRRLVGIPQLSAEEFGFEVSGGEVEGTQPVTQNRGTEAEGDNIVQTMKIDELAAAHFGQLDAFSRRFPKDAEEIQDPKSLKALMDHITRLYYAADGEMPPAAKVNSMALADKKLENAKSLATTKNKQSMALEDKRHKNALARSSAPKDLSNADRAKMISDTVKLMQKDIKEAIENGDMDPADKPSVEELVDAAAEQVDSIVAKTRGAAPPAAPEGLSTPAAQPMLEDDSEVDPDALQSALDEYL